MKYYSKNPRTINKRQFTDLEKWLRELGDLSGIVHDLNSDEIISGNQRGRVFDINSCKIVLTEELDEPDAQGTVAMGYVVWDGQRYGYRAVRWTPRQAEQANIVANKAGGEWDWDILANQFDVPDLLDWGFTDFEFGIGKDDIDWSDAFGNLPDGDRAPFQQMTFTLHDEQVEQVKAAVAASKAMGDFDGSLNENSNGNALARICETFVTEHGQG